MSFLSFFAGFLAFPITLMITAAVYEYLYPEELEDDDL